MGTQQILLIVLSVIIVGVAVSVGIQMFNTQKDSGAMQAIATDLQSFGAQLIAFENTPSSMGGAKGAAATTAAAAGLWLGWGDDAAITNNNATYTVTGTGAAYVITVSASATGNTGNGSTCAVGPTSATPVIVLATG
ncbi:MAG: hypothetical protein KAS49_07605 [Candidatus Cloacimonetes bacterium]|nr:hypothetical protein [Candidatus Cloacimonadota bacterium]